MGINIKADTIGNYLSAAAEIYTDKNLPNPYSKTINKSHPHILLRALRKYEKVADRREVITEAMFMHIDDLASRSTRDSLASALKDWYAFNRYGGCRQSEWCQTKKKSFTRLENDPNGEPLAFIMDDLKAFGSSDCLLSFDTASFAEVEYFTVCWRFQKNTDNGEIQRYWKDTREKWCPCFALWSIVQRARRLQIPPHEPVAQYINDRHKCRFITDKDVAESLQTAAKVVHKIKDESTLSRWTSHSLRVTAANELHRLGFGGVFIQCRLRWRSDSFLRYLRNTIHVARQHTEAMGLSPSNLNLERLLEPSNSEKANEIRTKLNFVENVYRTSADDDILWDKRLLAAPAC